MFFQLHRCHGCDCPSNYAWWFTRHASTERVPLRQRRVLRRFDIPAFYGEAARVLRPGGTLAVWGYCLASFVGEPEATEALRRLYHDTLGPYWDPRKDRMDAKYAGEPARMALNRSAARAAEC